MKLYGFLFLTFDWVYIYFVCCAKESKLAFLSMPIKLAKCIRTSKGVLLGHFALVCLVFIYLFACFCFAWIQGKCQMLQLWLEHLVLVLRRVCCNTARLCCCLYLLPYTDAVLFLVLCHTMRTTPVLWKPLALTMGREQPGSLPPVKGNRCLCLCKTTPLNFDCHTGAQVEDARSWMWAAGSAGGSGSPAGCRAVTWHRGATSSVSCTLLAAWEMPLWGTEIRSQAPWKAVFLLPLLPRRTASDKTPFPFVCCPREAACPSSTSLRHGNYFWPTPHRHRIHPKCLAFLTREGFAPFLMS